MYSSRSSEEEEDTTIVGPLKKGTTPRWATIVGSGPEPTTVVVVVAAVKDPTLVASAADILTPKDKDGMGSEVVGGEGSGQMVVAATARFVAHVGPLWRPKW